MDFFLFLLINLLGRKLPFSEQLTALIVFELLFYGLFPGAVPFVYFIGKSTKLSKIAVVLKNALLLMRLTSWL